MGERFLIQISIIIPPAPRSHLTPRTSEVRFFVSRSLCTGEMRFETKAGTAEGTEERRDFRLFLRDEFFAIASSDRPVHQPHIDAGVPERWEAITDRIFSKSVCVVYGFCRN
jgi:hypothetical protein